MVLSYISRDARQLDSTILFDIAELDHKNSRYPLMPVKWELKDFKRLTAWAQQIAEPKNNAMCLTYLENHDQARCVTRYGNESPEHRVTSAKMLATYLLTMSGSCVIYEGQEIGSESQCSSANGTRRSHTALRSDQRAQGLGH